MSASKSSTQNSFRLWITSSQKETRNPRKLFLRFSKEGTPLLEQVLPVLQKYTGPYPVYFYFEENKKVIQSRKEFWVEDFETLIGDLGQILGRENVAWKVS
jgi:DNA polymerase-3 subunit alpha